MPFWYHKSYVHWQSTADLARNDLFAKYAQLSPQHFGFGPGDDQAAAHRALYELVAYPHSIKLTLDNFFFDAKKNPYGGIEQLILTLHPYKLVRLYQIFHFHYLGLCYYYRPASTLPVLRGSFYVYPSITQSYIESWCEAGEHCLSEVQPWSDYTLKLGKELTTLLQAVTPDSYVPTQAECDCFLTLNDHVAPLAEHICSDNVFQTSVLKAIRS
jgi:hypothetical protein